MVEESYPEGYKRLQKSWISRYMDTQPSQAVTLLQVPLGSI